MSEAYAFAVPDKRELRRFGLVFATALCVFFGLLLPWLFSRPWPAWPWIGAMLFGGAGLLLPGLLRPVYRIWMLLGHTLGWINTRIILGLVFFVLFTPLALAFRLFGKDPLHRKADPVAESYRVPSVKLPRERLEKPF